MGLFFVQNFVIVYENESTFVVDSSTSNAWTWNLWPTSIRGKQKNKSGRLRYPGTSLSGNLVNSECACAYALN